MASENEKRETLADIVAEIRAYGAQPPPRLMWLDIADRIEAVARDNCRDCVHNPKGKNYEGGNAAAMREALLAIKEVADRDMRHHVSMSESDQTSIRAWANLFVSLVDSALAEPPRNCDVGTAEEQSDRFANLCDSQSGCSQCPVKSLWNFANGHKPSCGVLWAQMPYAAEEGGAK